MRNETAIQKIKLPFRLDFDEIEINENAKNFITNGDVRSAALMLADIFDGRIIYNAAENDKKFYFFNGHIWQYEPDIMGVIYDTLFAVLHHFIRASQHTVAEKEKSQIKGVLKAIEKRTLRVKIQRELAGLKEEGVYRNSDDPGDALQFDGDATKETLTLADGVMDFSGREVVFRKAKPEEFRSRGLDYKIEDVKKGGPCERIWKFMRGNFKNEDTLQTLMYYLSIIPSKMQYKYGGFWIGGKNTGKSTTMRLIWTVYGHLTHILDPNLIASKRNYFSFNNYRPVPCIARLPGKAVAFASDLENGVYLNTGLWKILTGNGYLHARDLHKKPIQFVNTAQIVIVANSLPRFDHRDGAIIARAIVIPFLVPHDPKKRGTIRPDELIEHLRPEFPAFIRLLAEYYVRLKHEHKGIIPLSNETDIIKWSFPQEDK